MSGILSHLIAYAGSLQATWRNPGSDLGPLRFVSTVEEDPLIDMGWQLRRGKEGGTSFLSHVGASASRKKEGEVLHNAQVNP